MTLTLKIEKHIFCMTLHLMIIHHHTKFCQKRLSSAGDIIWTKSETQTGQVDGQTKWFQYTIPPSPLINIVGGWRGVKRRSDRWIFHTLIYWMVSVPRKWNLLFLSTSEGARLFAENEVVWCWQLHAQAIPCRGAQTKRYKANQYVPCRPHSAFPFDFLSITPVDLATTVSRLLIPFLYLDKTNQLREKRNQL